MRAPAAAAIALVAAVAGGLGALAIGRVGGLLAGETTTYVVTEQSQSGAARAAVESVARPAVGSFDPARIYAERSPGVVTVFAFFGDSALALSEQSQGSGFVVSRDGVILTSSHVITNAGDATGGPASVAAAKEVYVEFSDGDRVPAQVIGWDVFDDVGAIRIDTADHPVTPVPLGDSSRVVVGEPVAAIGSPFGNEDSLSVGVVSATRSIASLTSQYDVADAIQTDAPINHGNSGGPLFDAHGRVIGINAQIRSGGRSGGFEGVGFAVPIDAARRSLRQLLATGTVVYAYVGIETDDLTPSIAREYGYPVLHGALIRTVVAASAAERAGLRAGTTNVRHAGMQVRIGGDAIVAIGKEPVREASDVARIVAGELEPGQTVRFEVVRDGKRVGIPVRLDERPTR